MKNFDGHWIGTEIEETSALFRCSIEVSENVFTFSFTKPKHPPVKMVRLVSGITGEEVKLSGSPGADPITFTMLAEDRIQFRGPNGTLSVFERT